MPITESFTKLKNIICKQCKEPFMSQAALYRHYWDNHLEVALCVYAMSEQVRDKLVTFEEVALEGLVGHADISEIGRTRPLEIEAAS